MSNPQQLVQKLWNYCNILRDDGLSYSDYVEQLTFLLFLKMADEQSLDREQKKWLKSGTLNGIELVDSVARLCCMNLLLHGIGPEGDAGSGDPAYNVPVTVKDALTGKHGEYDIVLANPPFGKKSSVTIVNEAGEQEKESLVINRDDFWASTSNKQLNFLQHIFTILKQHGRAAVVLPDNVLFEGGAGETIRRELLKQADVHTLLRLPTGIFTRKASKPTSCSLTANPRRKSRGPRSSGFTTCAPTCISRSRKIRSSARTWMSS